MRTLVVIDRPTEYVRLLDRIVSIGLPRFIRIDGQSHIVILK